MKADLNSKKEKKKKKPLKKKKRVSKKAAGQDLFNQMVKLTGIPGEAIRRELTAILEKKNVDLNSLTLEQLRMVVASYLREIMGNLLDRAQAKRSDTTH